MKSSSEVRSWLQVKDLGRVLGSHFVCDMSSAKDEEEQLTRRCHEDGTRGSDF